MNRIILRDECSKIMGACFEVYKEKGSGFLEAVFQECVEFEPGLQGIPFAKQVPLQITCKGRLLAQRYIADLVCFDRVIVELKAVSKLTDEHRSQLLNYLHATGYRLGLLINFGHHPKLEWERMVL